MAFPGFRGKGGGGGWSISWFSTGDLVAEAVRLVNERIRARKDELQKQFESNLREHSPRRTGKLAASWRVRIRFLKPTPLEDRPDLALLDAVLVTVTNDTPYWEVLNYGGGKHHGFLFAIWHRTLREFGAVNVRNIQGSGVR